MARRSHQSSQRWLRCSLPATRTPPRLTPRQEQQCSVGSATAVTARQGAGLDSGVDASFVAPWSGAARASAWRERRRALLAKLQLRGAGGAAPTATSSVTDDDREWRHSSSSDYRQARASGGEGLTSADQVDPADASASRPGAWAGRERGKTPVVEHRSAAEIDGAASASKCAVSISTCPSTTGVQDLFVRLLRR